MGHNSAEKAPSLLPQIHINMYLPQAKGLTLMHYCWSLFFMEQANCNCCFSFTTQMCFMLQYNKFVGQW